MECKKQKDKANQIAPSTLFSSNVSYRAGLFRLRLGQREVDGELELRLFPLGQVPALLVNLDAVKLGPGHLVVLRQPAGNAHPGRRAEEGVRVGRGVPPGPVDFRLFLAARTLLG